MPDHRRRWVLGWLAEGQTLAAKIEARSPGYQGWADVSPLGRGYEETLAARRNGDPLLIYPTDQHLLRASELLERHGLHVRNLEERIYLVRRFDMPEDYDPDTDWDPDLVVVNMEERIAFGEDGLEQTLQNFDVSIDMLMQVAACNYPF